MNGHQIDNVARDTPIGCRCRLVGREIGRMQHVPEQGIWHRRKEPERGIRRPLQFGCFAFQRDQSLPLATSCRIGTHRISRLLQRRAIGVEGNLQSRFGIVENVDVAGVAWPVAIDRYSAGNITVRAALLGQ